MQFCTKNNRKYYYSNIDGYVYPDVIIEEEKKVELEYDQVIDENSIKNYLERNGNSQLTLIIDEMCNMRCKYCI